MTKLPTTFVTRNVLIINVLHIHCSKYTKIQTTHNVLIINMLCTKSTIVVRFGSLKDRRDFHIKKNEKTGLE